MEVWNHDKLLPLRALLNENAEKVELRLGDFGSSLWHGLDVSNRLSFLR